MITIDNIQQKLVEAIKLSGLKQKDIANRLGVGQQTISHYIKGDKMPSLETFANLCAVLDVDANDLLCLNDKQ